MRQVDLQQTLMPGMPRRADGRIDLPVKRGCKPGHFCCSKLLLRSGTEVLVSFRVCDVNEDGIDTGSHGIVLWADAYATCEVYSWKWL